MHIVESLKIIYRYGNKRSLFRYIVYHIYIYMYYTPFYKAH